MKLDNWTALTTNSSSMIYVVREGMEEKAEEVLRRWGSGVLENTEQFWEFAESYPHIVEHVFGIREPEINYRAIYDGRLTWEEISNMRAEYVKSARKLFANSNVIWFSPPREDNEMSEYEMKDYEYVSKEWFRLS